jgi:hypothetical protein
MTVNRERYEKWIKDILEPRYPELVKPLRAALGAYYRIKRSGHVGKRELDPILRCAYSSRTWLFGTAAEILSDLTSRHQEARDAVRKMTADGQSRVRYTAVICLGRRTPRAFTAELLRKALRDKSSRVRGKAADWILLRDLNGFVPDLQEALITERHEETKQTIDFSLRLLRDGFILHQEDDGFDLSVKLADGVIGCYSVSAKEMKRKGLPKIIAEKRKADIYRPV